jgi:hypothetical protein
MFVTRVLPPAPSTAPSEIGATGEKRTVAKKDDEKDYLDELAQWQERYETDDEPENPKELFKQVSHIALYLSYDLIDKLQWWEKETLKLSDEEIEKRLPHMATVLEKMKVAYLEFSDLEF